MIDTRIWIWIPTPNLDKDMEFGYGLRFNIGIHVPTWSSVSKGYIYRISR